MPIILKYPLEPSPMQTIKTAAGKVLTVQMQDGRATMWVLVDEAARPVERVVHQVMTGLFFEPGDAQYVSTVVIEDFGLVIHVFVTDGTEVTPENAEN